LLRFGRSDTVGLAPAGLLDAFIVTVVLLLLVWVTTISPLGFDADGRQVWGATKGPYVFRRVVASSSVEEAP